MFFFFELKNNGNEAKGVEISKINQFGSKTTLFWSLLHKKKKIPRASLPRRLTDIEENGGEEEEEEEKRKKKP